MDCKYCAQDCRLSGRQRSGVQRYYCTGCKKYQQKEYSYRACRGTINETIKSLVCESVGIRGISWVLKIATNTVLGRIKRIADAISQPPIPQNKPAFEVDELWTYIGRKENEYWLAYALDKTTRQVIDFVIGKRTKASLKTLIDKLLVSGVRKLRTDKLTIYQRLIPKGIHCYGVYCTNHIERKNLSIRTHIKRLSRRTICFNRSARMLESCLKIYFWERRAVKK
jgi:IS1 family transposase/transposase-like protein